MATVFYPRSAAPVTDLTLSSHGGFDVSAVVHKGLALTRGGSAASESDATIASINAHGWGAEADTIFGTSLWFISEPLAAVSITANPTANIRALETNAMANYGVGLRIYKISTTGQVQDDGPDPNANGTNVASELGTSEAARSVTATLSDTIVVASGERLAVVLFFCPVGTTASGYTATGFYNGPTAAASGDTYVTFTETITEQGAGPAANPPYDSSQMMTLIAQ